MKVVILAGGGGTRLWPLSRQKKPKQAQKIFGRETLLEKTFKRLRKDFKTADIFVSCGAGHYPMFKKDLPRLPRKNFILEPVARNTAGAIGLAAVTLHHKDPKAILVMANADHVIDNEPEYLRVLRAAEQTIRKYPDHTVLIGTNPTYPDTGSGYIEMGEQKDKIKKYKIFVAKRFIEKPGLKTARQFLKKWNFLWNPAYFVWRVDHLLNLFRKYLPHHYKILKNIEKSLGTSKENIVLRKEFSKLKTILINGKPASIDYGIMVKLKNKMLVIPGQFAFTDVGHWRSVKEIMAKKASANVILGKHSGINTKDCLIYSLSDKLIATVGLEKMVVIDTPDALLICPKDKAQDVREIVEQLKKHGHHKYL